MRVDTRENSLGNFGALLPNLSELKLSNSIIATVRDLGTSLTNLRTLWLARSGLSDLDGISSVSSLKELYLAFNHIEDVSPVSMLDQLEILDLEGNNVSDITQVEFLCLCSSLKILTLEGNPICTAAQPLASSEEIQSYDYRSAIHKAVPNVKILDDEPFLVEKVDGKPVLRQPPASHRATKVPEHLKEDWQLVSEGIKAIDVEEEEENPADLVRPGSAAGTSRQNRPSSAMSTRQRPMSASRQRPSSAMGQRPGSAGGGSEPVGVFRQDDSSDLTHGSSQVICGNISRALKSRQKDLKTPKMPVVTFLESPRLYTPEKSFEDDTEPSASKQDILNELKAWREEYSKMLNDERSTIAYRGDQSRAPDSELPKTSPMMDAPVTRAYSPSPPSRPPEGPAALRRSLPNPPSVGREILSRPNTAADFRMRRFRQLSGETSVNQLRLRTLHGDESFEVDKNLSTPSLDTRPSVVLLAEDDTEPRSSSAPVRINRRPRNLPSTKDDIRPSRKLPDPPFLGQRPGTAAAALQKRRLKPFQE